MRRRRLLELEILEDRTTPSTLGQPWADPGHLTLSFAPDGTSINGAPSDLFQTLNRAAPTAQWEQVILQAFQTWAENTNVNIGLVADGGQPFGIDGAVQGDVRFGDIRIGMAALPANLVATTSPFSWTGSTWSGDVIFNSSYSFGVNGNGQYDLYTVALHEAGHSLGIADNTSDVGSIMYANYTGPKTGLDSLDVANIQAMYGARTADVQINNTLATATAIGSSPAQLGFNADLSSATDVDYYKVTTPLLNLLPSSVTFDIDAAGESLLTPTLSVYNASGQLLATQSAASPFSNNVSVTLPDVAPLTTLYFEVSHTGNDGFGVGVYSAQVIYKNPLSIITGIVPALVPGVVDTISHLNTSITSATMLTSAFGQTSDQRFNYLYQANIVTVGDADFYRFTAPAAPAGTTNYALDAIVWQTAPGGLAPVLHLFDAKGNPIPVQVMADSSSVFSMQISGVTTGEVLYVEVAAQTTKGAGSSGGYVLAIKFNPLPETVAPTLGSNTLPTASSTDSGTLAMNQNGVFYFELGAANGSSAVSSDLTMTVKSQNGEVLLSLTAVTGADPRTAAVYLPAGIYSITYSITSTTGRAYQPITYWLSGEILSEPIGPYYAGASSSSSPSTAPPSSSSSPPPTSTSPSTTSSPPPSSSATTSSPPPSSSATTSSPPPSSSATASSPPPSSTATTSSPPPSSSATTLSPPPTSSATTSSPPPSSSATTSTPPQTSSSSTTTGSSSSPSTTISSTTTFPPSGVSVSITTSAGTVVLTIPPPGSTSTQSFTTAGGATTVTLSTASNGYTTLTLTTYASNTITTTQTTSGSTSTLTLATTDGIRVSIQAPVPTAAPTYAGASSNTAPPYNY